MECKCWCHTDDSVRHKMACCSPCPTCGKRVKSSLKLHMEEHKTDKIQIDWRRGLGLQIRPVTLKEAEDAYQHLYGVANSYDDTRKYGMHIALQMFITEAREELGSEN